MAILTKDFILNYFQTSERLKTFGWSVFDSIGTFLNRNLAAAERKSQLPEIAGISIGNAEMVNYCPFPIHVYKGACVHRLDGSCGASCLCPGDHVITR